jgi:predicted unusual protein kinase regulating ubiquinone biosynthesis (AarF/ABC1/UbiB family)
MSEPSLESSLPDPVRPSLRFRARYRRVLLFSARNLLGILLWDLFLPRLGLAALARRTARARYRRLGEDFCKLAGDLGGVWIKVGQFLSARIDVLPAAITDQLANLQDEIAPETLQAMQQVVEQEFGKPLKEVFPWFDPQPLASASLGQVHRARLASGESVVVKVQRPDIDDILRVDLAALATILGWLKRYRPITRRADLDALFSEFSRTLWAEVDYLAEAENARRFGEMFAADPATRIPAVHSAHTTKRVLTLEDVYFIKITDFAAIEAAGVSRADVAQRLFHTYLHQIFIEGFFHADPHPGNLFVEPQEGEGGGWRLVFVDFGMVGHLTPQAKHGLQDLAIAMGTRDPDRLVRAYDELGILLPGADRERIRQAEASLFQRFWGKSMRELTRLHPREMHQFAAQFRDLLYEMPFQVPTDLIFLGRCVAILGGICTGMDPDFNLFQGLAPFAEQLLSGEQADWIDRILNWLVEEGRSVLSLPSRMEAMLARIDRGDVRLIARADPELEKRLRALTRAIERLVGSVVFAALLLVGSLLTTSGHSLLGGIGLGLAGLALLWVLLP